MRKFREEKNKFLIISLILLTLGIGLGYAVLSQQLTIDNTISYDSMKWEVGFSSVADNGGTITSTSSIGSDGKSITVNCDLGLSTSQESCIVKATITNNSTFDIGLTDDPIITYDDTYIHTLTFKWNNHPTYENYTVYKDNFIAKGETEEVILTIKTKNLNEIMLPSQDISIPITITLNFAEWQKGSLPTKNDLAILKKTSSSDSTAFRNSTYRKKIKTITFEDEINVPTEVIESWDIGEAQNGNVMAYVTPNATDSTYYDLYIQSNTQLYANNDMSYWFKDITYVDSINGLELLDTSNVANMGAMFLETGAYSKTFTLDVSNFDTSNVTNMSAMFRYAGYQSQTFTLDVSNFDTSKVTNMSQMFYVTGYTNPTFTLDVSNFNTSNVTNMYWMFNATGYSSPTFTLDLSNFDTSNVTNMGGMFWETGRSSTTFTLDLSNFDTSNVTNMRSMFEKTGGRYSKTFTLDLGTNFDTSNVTDMNSMFYEIGYNSTKLNISITIRNPNITEYDNMFEGVATKTGAKVTVNYTSETSDLVDQMIATKSSNSNVVKGVQVD